jgi:hypothetical protein
MTRLVTVELPEAATRAINVAPEYLPRELREAAVLRWFEEGRLFQGQAASALGLARGEFFDLLAVHRVSPVQMSAAELDHDFGRG